MFLLQDGNSGEEFNKDSIERDDRRLIELGWKTLELFALAHIFRLANFQVQCYFARQVHSKGQQHELCFLELFMLI